MSGKERVYVAIDLKSFYASVECVERQLDPLTTNLVVADPERTEKTICLAVSPSLKAYGIPGRPRLFEVVRRVKEINRERRGRAPGRQFSGSSCYGPELAEHPELELAYIVAPPRMAFYVEYSTIIYDIYLKYIAPEDIHVYSIDEVLMDVTDYLQTYRLTARELAASVRFFRPISASFSTTWFTTWSPPRKWWWKEMVMPSFSPAARTASSREGRILFSREERSRKFSVCFSGVPEKAPRWAISSRWGICVSICASMAYSSSSSTVLSASNSSISRWARITTGLSIILPLRLATPLPRALASAMASMTA